MYFGRLRRQAALLRCGRKRRDSGLTQKCLCFQLGFLRFERCSVGSQPFGLGLLFPRGFLLGLFGRFGCAFGKRLADKFVDFGLLLGRKNGLVVPAGSFVP